MAGAAWGVAEGVATAGLTGTEYGVVSGLVDAGGGALCLGVLSKLGKFGRFLARFTDDAAEGARRARVANRGSSANRSKGTALPRNLNEQIATLEVLENPTGGIVLPLRMTDPRWPAEEGWVKMQQIVKPKYGDPINVHYVRNRVTGEIDDIKIKLPERR